MKKREALHVGRPNSGDRALFDELVDGMFERLWFTNRGLLVERLEATLRDYLGVRHCIPVCNGTLGLQIALRALELTGEVVVPAFTFIATAHALRWEGLRPVFVDINPDTHNLDPQRIESLITERTSAILGVHLWGRACDTLVIEEIASKHGLSVIYDAAHAFGCCHRDKMIGNFGDCEVFSFHATKFFHSFEGGAIATNNDLLARRIRLMKNFGFSGADNVIHLGTNAKMPEICAAMGLACFAKLDESISTNRENYEAYRTGLADLQGVRLIEWDRPEEINCQYVLIEVDGSGISRDALLDHLHANAIYARRYFYPGCHRMEPYRSLYPDQTERLPCTDLLCGKILTLPTGSAVAPDDIAFICRTIREAVVAKGVETQFRGEATA